jgi:hypothetical protein
MDKPELARQAVDHLALDPVPVVLDVALSKPFAVNRRSAASASARRVRLGDITDELAAKLTAHLSHEETDGLALIDVSLTPQQWQDFAHAHGQRLGGDAPMYMPWLLNGASPQMLDAVLDKFPPPLLAAYRDQWAPAYATLTIWPSVSVQPGRAGSR